MNNKSRVNHRVHLSYRDVLLVPYDQKFCTIKSRNDPDISSEICRGKRLQVPLVSAPMDSITGLRMAIALDKLGALGIQTRYINNPDELRMHLSFLRSFHETADGYAAVAVGVKNGVYDHVKALCDTGLSIVCLDIANGNHEYMAESLKAIAPLKDQYDLSVIAGNVATAGAAIRLAEHGADAVKIGIGPGAACTTRRVTGFGVPQFTAILDCAEAMDVHHLPDVRLIADGGIRFPGDAVKAIWAGAHTVMLGYVFAGHDECPRMNGMTGTRGELGGKYLYRGMSSRTVSGRSDIAPEGVCVEVPPKGPVSKTVKEWAAAIRAACSMANANNLDELRRNVTAIRVSTMSSQESDPVNSE